MVWKANAKCKPSADQVIIPGLTQDECFASCRKNGKKKNKKTKKQKNDFFFIKFFFCFDF